MPRGGKAKTTVSNVKRGPQPIHATFDGDCENCGGAFEIGDWVIPMDEDGYEFFVHETCPAIVDGGGYDD